MIRVAVYEGLPSKAVQNWFDSYINKEGVASWGEVWLCVPPDDSPEAVETARFIAEQIHGGCSSWFLTSLTYRGRTCYLTGSNTS